MKQVRILNSECLLFFYFWHSNFSTENAKAIYRLFIKQVVDIQQIFPPSVFAVINFHALVRPKWSISKVARQTDTDHHQQHVGWSQPETTRGASTWGLIVDHRSNISQGLRLHVIQLTHASLLTPTLEFINNIYNKWLIHNCQYNI